MFSFLKVLLENNSIYFNVFIALIVIYIIYYVRNITTYPRGPIPLPFIGNILTFKGKLNDPPPFVKFSEWKKKYGPIYTFWAGHTPIVVVNTYELNNEAAITRKNDIIERADNSMNRMLKNNSQNVFTTSGPYWEALKKVAVFAIRKFAVSETLPQIINEVMDEAIDLMVKERQIENPVLYIDFMIYNILSLTAYGKKFGPIDDPQFIEAKKYNDDFYEFTGNGLVSDYIPWLWPLYYKFEKKLEESMRISVGITRNEYLDHKKTFTPGVIRDFTDCVIEAKEEAIRENFQRKDYLNDNNLFMVVSDLFLAGTDSTQTTMRWILLMLGNDPTLQQKIFEEIDENIGDRFPTQDDKNILNLTYAFLLEILRFRPPAPMGVDHMTGVDTELGGKRLPKNTYVLFNLIEQNNDPKYWTNPEKFDPHRFLDSNGKLKTGRFPSFVPFGLGRRGCPGEKLALNNNFLMITRLVQRMKVQLSTGAGTANVVPANVMIGCFPRDYQIKCFLR